MMMRDPSGAYIQPLLPFMVYTEQVKVPDLNGITFSDEALQKRNAALNELSHKMAVELDMQCFKLLFPELDPSKYAEFAANLPPLAKPKRKPLHVRLRYKARHAVSRFVHWLDTKYCNEYHDEW